MPAPAKPLTREQFISDIKSFKEPAMGLLDLLAGAAKGSVSATLGAPGDIESLVRMIPGLEREKTLGGLIGGQRETILPTSEEVSGALPSVLPSTAAPQRKASAQFGEDVGAFIPTPGTSAAMRVAGQAVKAAPRVAGEMAGDLLMPRGTSLQRQRGAIKMPGGNWLAGEVEGATEPLKRSTRGREFLTPEERANPVLAHAVQLADRNYALNNWIDKKLNRYIRNEMATPEDPVRKLAEQGVSHMQGLADNEGYVGIGMKERRKAAGLPVGGLGESRLAKNWEVKADQAINAQTAGTLSDPSQWFAESTPDFQKQLKANPWLSKLPPETPVYEAAATAENFPRMLGFDHLIDELRNSIDAASDLPARLRWKPEDLDKVTMEQAVKRVNDINEYRAAKKAEANEALARNPATVDFKTYETVPGTETPNQKGLAWKQITTPTFSPKVVQNESGTFDLIDSLGRNQRDFYGSFKTKQEAERELQGLIENNELFAVGPSQEGRQALEQALSYEGDVMGHCVGGYCDDVLSGRSQIYSLRDKKGEPHVTIEIRAPRMPQEQRDAKVNALVEELVKEGFEKQKAVEQANRLYPIRETFSEITQIKGKQNRAPKEEYLPFVQDFVKSGQWSDVRDMQNTGLFKVTQGQRLPGFSKEIDPGFYTIDDFKRMAQENEMPQEIQEAWFKKLKDQSRYGYARGGSVRISDNPDTMRLELQAGGAVEAVKAAAKAAKKAAEKPAYTAKQLESAAEKIAPQLQKENPKLSDADAMKKAMRLAEKKLEWEKVEKPELEKTYGALEKAKYSAPLAERQRNVPEVVQKRIKETQEFLKQPTEPWTPPRKELQAFERERIKEALEGFPGIEQTKFPRYEPAQANIGYVGEIYDDPVNRELIKGQIKRGLPLGGETFYASLYPLKLAALERGIPESKFNEFIYSIAPASARNSIMNEMAVGQFMRDMRARGLSLDEDTVKREMAAFKEKYGTGLPLMPIHREGVKSVLEGGQDLREMLKADIPTNYKIPTYGTQKAGDFAKSVVLDVHESAGQTRGSPYHPYFTEQGGFGPTEYGAAENKMLGIAGELGIPGGMAQAGRWFGGGELTGLKSPRGDALDLLEKQTAYTLQGMGITPTPRNIRNYVLDMIEKGEGVLMPWFKKEGMPDVRTEKKKGGAVRKPRKVKMTSNLDAMRLALKN